jgi:hypothetical protein
MKVSRLCSERYGRGDMACPTWTIKTIMIDGKQKEADAHQQTVRFTK